MKTKFVCLVALLCFGISYVSGQNSESDPNSVCTVWYMPSGEHVFYCPTDAGSRIDVCRIHDGPCDNDVDNCFASPENERKCRDILKWAEGGKKIELPGGNKRPKTTQNVMVEQIMDIFEGYPDKKPGKLYAVSLDNKVVEIKDSKAWLSKIKWKY